MPSCAEGKGRPWDGLFPFSSKFRLHAALPGGVILQSDGQLQIRTLPQSDVAIPVGKCRQVSSLHRTLHFDMAQQSRPLRVSVLNIDVTRGRRQLSAHGIDIAGARAGRESSDNGDFDRHFCPFFNSAVVKRRVIIDGPPFCDAESAPNHVCTHGGDSERADAGARVEDSEIPPQGSAPRAIRRIADGANLDIACERETGSRRI